jgi:hypothetical protein
MSRNAMIGTNRMRKVSRVIRRRVARGTGVHRNLRGQRREGYHSEGENLSGVEPCVLVPHPKELRTNRIGNIISIGHSTMQWAN